MAAVTQEQLAKICARLETVADRLEHRAGSAGVNVSGPSAESDAPVSPVMVAFDESLQAPFETLVTVTETIGCAELTDIVRLLAKAMVLHRNVVIESLNRAQPNDAQLQDMLKPLSEALMAVSEVRDRNRPSKMFNHLSAISEGIPALGWVAVRPKPAPFVKDMSDAAAFYTNRVLKDYKDKDEIHVSWSRAWNRLLTALHDYIRAHHTTGLVWKSGGSAPPFAWKMPAGASVDGPKTAPPAPAGPPPPPPPPAPSSSALLQNVSTGGDAAPKDDRSQLFAQINKGTDITKGLKHVEKGQKKLSNVGPRPFKPTPPPKPTSNGSPHAGAAVKQKPAPVKELRNKKWCIEYQENAQIILDDVNMKQSIYLFKCTGTVVQVKGKVNTITMDSCRKCGIAFESCLSSCEFVNCQSVQGQVIGTLPTVSVDKTDGCLIYLSANSLNCQIVTAKSSEVNVSIPNKDEDGDFIEHPIPEQFKTQWNGSKWVTTATESV